MKNKKAASVVFIGILVVLYAIFKLFTNQFEGLKFPPYTTFSTGESGASLLYDTLDKMGYPVAKDAVFISPERSKESIQIVIVPNAESIGKSSVEAIAKWVAVGGKLLYFEENGDTLEREILQQAQPDKSERLTFGNLYYIGLGKMFVGSAKDLTNESLIIGNGEFGGFITELIEYMGYGTIYFNEAYHGYNVEKGLFEALPVSIKLIVCQIAIFTVVVLLYFGKRYGSAKPYFEEIERVENEYVYTLSNLYMSTGHGEAVMSIYAEKLLKLSEDYFKCPVADFEQIRYLWRKEGLSGIDKLEYIIENNDSSYNTNKRKNKSDFMKAYSYYKELIKQVSKH